MINEVRNAVMSVINKNNYGYISPSDFNLYAKQAQLDIYEDYFNTFSLQSWTSRSKTNQLLKEEEDRRLARDGHTLEEKINLKQYNAADIIIGHKK